MNRHIRLAIWVMAVIPLRILAQTTATAPTTDLFLPEGPLTATITAFEGLVSIKTAPGQPWQKPSVGMMLSEGAEFRTGPRSVIQFVIPPDQVVTLDRMGTLQLLRASFEDGKLLTDLGMKYGRTRYDIESAGREYDAKVRSPNSVLAVRGTNVSLYDQPPFTPEAVSFTGSAQFRDLRKRIRFGGTGRTVVRADSDSPAELSRSLAYVDPSIRDARTPAEQRLIEQLVSTGGIVTIEEGSDLRIVSGGVPPTTAELVAAPPGALNFILRWTNDADLNLTIAPIGLEEIVTPVFPLNRSPSGGKTAFDHRGGPNGGFEIIFWPPGFPGSLPGTEDDITYVDAIEFISGQPTPFEFTTVVDGEVISSRSGTAGPSASPSRLAGPAASPSHAAGPIAPSGAVGPSPQPSRTPAGRGP